jgi:hypothetical protein
MANVVYCNDSNLCKNNYYYALATELFLISLLCYQLIMRTLLIPAPISTTSPPMPQLPSKTFRLQPLESTWPTVAPNAWWPVPPLHLQPLYLHQLCRGMSCLNSPILSLAWACLPTKIAQLSLNKPQSQSTTQMAIQFSQAGRC